ncbi:MAG: carbohydrate porin [Scandinavium sp.]|uniref:carbohydrate porin n=1 Tax=Scandinavium sp. TaxID=2830653 RepID=UPI003F2B3460
MKKTTMAVAVGLLLIANTAAAKSTLTLEQRLQILEERLESAEHRATTAEKEVRQLKAQQTTDRKDLNEVQERVTVQNITPKEEVAKNASSPSLSLSGYGDLKIYGDVEFNIDAESRKGSLISRQDNSNERWDLNGRILLGFDGVRKMQNGYFAGFRAQPLADMTGSVDLDDAAFFFGQENDWKIKVGRFEAYDIFPLNQDTFVEHSGNTANDLYDDGHGYIYMMKEGRGRSDSGGSFLMSKQLDNWYFELNTLLEDGTSLYSDDNYHGREVQQQKNVAYLRPVVAWSEGAFSVAAAMESNVVNNAYGYYDARGRFIDQSERTGYGMTMTWNGLKNDPVDGVVLNLNTAYLDATDEEDFSAGVNALWRRFELGYIYAHNRIGDYAVSTTCTDDCWFRNAGTYDIHTVHASYQIPNVMNMQNFNIYLGAYWSKLEGDGTGGSDDSRYGGRVRFKYFF